jgi:hypothetical protein
MGTSAPLPSSTADANQRPVASPMRVHLRRLLTILVAVVCGLAQTSSAWASAKPAEPQAATEAKSDPSKRPPIPTLDLGEMEVKNAEPPGNNAREMSFHVHLAFSKETSPATIDALEHMEHRLREQVLVAIRTAELADFLDPELQRFRRRILFRVNRLLKDVQASDVFLANFTFSTD